jgi:hypothetical protein
MLLGIREPASPTSGFEVGGAIQIRIITLEQPMFDFQHVSDLYQTEFDALRFETHKLAEVFQETGFLEDRRNFPHAHYATATLWRAWGGLTSIPRCGGVPFMETGRTRRKG